MEFLEYLEVFFTEYTRRKSEMDLPDSKQKELLEQHYLLPGQHVQVISELKESAKERLTRLSLSEADPDTACFTTKDVLMLRRHTYLEFKLLQKWDKTFISLFSVLNCFTGAKLRFPSDETTLRDVADCTIDLWMLNPSYRDISGIDRLNQIAAAARRLRRRLGISITVSTGDLVLTDELLLAATAELERHMEAAGGIPVLERLFREQLNSKLNQAMHRYFIHRTALDPGSIKCPPQEIPYGYIFVIASKHLFHPVACVKTGKGYETILQLASDIFMLFDVAEPYAPLDLMTTVQELPKHIVDNAIFDTMCFPFQYAPDFCLRILDLYLPMQRKLFPQFTALKEVARWCLQLPPCSTFTLKEIHSRTGLSQKKIQCILDAFAQPWQQVNRAYSSPLDCANQWGYPVIQSPKADEYFQLCPQFSGYGFCKRLDDLLCQKESRIGRQLGTYLEPAAKRLLNEKHIPYHCGFYRGEHYNGQCDLILEDEKRILLIELKMRQLSVGFPQADDIMILQDLADGMLHGQLQTHRQRLQLMTAGSLPLYENEADRSSYYTLKHDNRSIYTMSVCLSEYAFLSQSFEGQKLLDAMLSGTFHTNDPNRSRALDKLNRWSKSLRELVTTYGLQSTQVQQLVHYSCFRSFQQFWLAVQLCHTPTEIIDLLTHDCGIVFSARDYYVGLEAWRRIHRSR